MKKVSTLLAVSLLVMMLTSVSAFADSVTKIETEQGGYLTLTNIVETHSLIQDDPQGSDTIYISSGPVTLTMVGDDPHPIILYYSEANVIDGSFMPLSDRESIEVTRDHVTFSEPGFYSGFVYFGPDFSFSNTAAFVILVTEGDISKGVRIEVDAYGSQGYVDIINVMDVQKFEDEEVGAGNVGDTLYIANQPVTLNINGNYPYYDIHYYPEVKFEGEFRRTNGRGELVVNESGFEEKEAYTETLTEPGYYRVNIRFSSDFSAARFLVQIVDDSSEESNEPAAIVDAKPTSSTVIVNDENVSFQAYNINGNNYFKLRDLAMVLSGTEKSFEVGWDAENNAITLESGKDYTAVGGELAVSGKPVTERGQLSTSTIYYDGAEVKLTAYLINGNNYFKLRDVANVIDFGVAWDGETNTIVIDSSTGYVAE